MAAVTDEMSNGSNDVMREDQSRDGRLEDAGHGTRRATPHEEHQRAVVQLEDATQVGPDSRARQHDRRLGSHRTTETDGDGTGQDGRPRVVTLDAPLAARDGIKDFSHPVADIVLHHIAHKEARQQDAHHGVHQVEVVGLGRVEMVGQEKLDPMYQLLQQQGGQRRADAHHEAEQEDELPVLDVLLAPSDEPGLPALHRIYRCILAHHCRMILTSPPLPSLMMDEGRAGAVSVRRASTI